MCASEWCLLSVLLPFSTFLSLFTAISLGQTLCDLNEQKCRLIGIVQGNGFPARLEDDIRHMHMVMINTMHKFKQYGHEHEQT